MWWRGREIQFYMTREDEEALVDFAFSKGDVWVVRDHWYEDEEYEAYDNPEEFFGQPVVDEIHKHPGWLFWNKDICGDDLVMRRISVRKSVKKIGGKTFHEIRMDVNHVVEFTRCIVKNNVMKDGRLACFGAYEDENGIRHNKESLAKWYARLARWLKRNSVRASCDGETPIFSLYIMPGALKFYQQGGKLGWFGREPVKKDLEKLR